MLLFVRCLYVAVVVDCESKRLIVVEEVKEKKNVFGPGRHEYLVGSDDFVFSHSSFCS